MQELLNKPLPQIPEEIKRAMGESITFTAPAEMNMLLCDEALQHEAGYRAYGKGNWQVSMYCPMPGLTAEMIRWWFWWHPQESLRYQVWYPGAHLAIGYDRKDKDYYTAKEMPPFRDTINYPKEIIGGKTSTIEIDFVTPEEFGFSNELMAENNIPLIVCGHVGLKGFVKHTEMAHIFKQTEDGLFMFSRFWMGEILKSRLIKNAAINESLARGMAEHCCIEYRNLAEILPGLYEEFGKHQEA